MTFIENITHRLRQRARYRQTVHAIRTLPTDIALDLDIYRGDAAKIAQRAVYGN